MRAFVVAAARGVELDDALARAHLEAPVPLRRLHAEAAQQRLHTRRIRASVVILQPFGDLRRLLLRRHSLVRRPLELLRSCALRRGHREAARVGIGGRALVIDGPGRPPPSRRRRVVVDQLARIWRHHGAPPTGGGNGGHGGGGGGGGGGDGSAGRRRASRQETAACVAARPPQRAGPLLEHAHQHVSQQDKLQQEKYGQRQRVLPPARLRLCDVVGVALKLVRQPAAVRRIATVCARATSRGTRSTARLHSCDLSLGRSSWSNATGLRSPRSWARPAALRSPHARRCVPPACPTTRTGSARSPRPSSRRRHLRLHHRRRRRWF